MKTLRLVGTALMAVLMAVNFTACSNDEEIVEPDSPKTHTIALDCIGEILNVTESPLGRATGNDLYAIQVYSLKEENMGGTGDAYIKQTPYAYGTFSSIEGVTIGLLEGYNYRFEVAMIVDGSINGAFMWSQTGNKFEFSTVTSFSDLTYCHSNYAHERFYGRLEEYTPTENGKAEIYMKRVSYGAKFIASDLTEGTLNINVASGGGMTNEYSIMLTPEVTENDNIYTFNNIMGAYTGTWHSTGYDPVTGQETGEYRDDYSETKDVTVSWTKADGTVNPLGTHSVTFKRNMRTTITIKAEVLTQENGVSITKEETPITDGDSYLIEGGEIINVTIGS